MKLKSSTLRITVLLIGVSALVFANCLNPAGELDVSQIVTRSPISLVPAYYDVTFQHPGSQPSEELNALYSARVSCGNLFPHSFSITPVGGPLTFDFNFGLGSPVAANLVVTDTTPPPGNADHYDDALIDNIRASTAALTAAPESSVELSGVASTLLLPGLLRLRTRTRGKSI
jgi:hypothetical protein